MKLLIFDFDGTLVDSRKLILESHRVFFGEFGFSLPSEDQSLSLIGISVELGPSEPHPGMVLQALSQAGMAAEDAFMIGDTTFDMEMGRATDVRGVAVSGGYR